MPTYEYLCDECGLTLELLQTYDEMLEARDRLRCQRCEGPLRWKFPAPHLQTDTSFAAGWGDGLVGSDRQRKDRHRQAREAGVATGGATYCPSLCEKGRQNDPKAWVPHHDAKGYIRKRCRELGRACEGPGLDYTPPEWDGRPDDKPYQVADRHVHEEVDQIVEKEHGGVIDPAKRADLFEATQERLSGNQD